MVCINWYQHKNVIQSLIINKQLYWRLSVLTINMCLYVHWLIDVTIISIKQMSTFDQTIRMIIVSISFEADQRTVLIPGTCYLLPNIFFQEVLAVKSKERVKWESVVLGFNDTTLMWYQGSYFHYQSLKHNYYMELDV